MSDLHKNINVLFIEDNLNWLKIFQILIQENTKDLFNYFYANTLNEALEILNKNSINLILLDLILPDSQPLNTIKIMSNVKIPTVIISTLDDEKFMQDAYNFGMQDYLVKDQYDLETYLHVCKQSMKRFIGITLNSIKNEMDDLEEYLKKLDSKLQII